MPGKPVTVESEEDGSFNQLHVSQATLGESSEPKNKGKDKAVLSIKSGEAADGKVIRACVLAPERAECCPLDLIFSDPVTFSVSGQHSVHLTGYFMPTPEEEFDMDDDYEAEEDDEAEEAGDEDEEDENEEDEHDGLDFPAATGNNLRDFLNGLQDEDDDEDEEFEGDEDDEYDDDDDEDDEDEDEEDVIFSNSSRTNVRIEEVGGRQEEDEDGFIVGRKRPASSSPVKEGVKKADLLQPKKKQAVSSEKDNEATKVPESLDSGVKVAGGKKEKAGALQEGQKVGTPEVKGKKSPVGGKGKAGKEESVKPGSAGKEGKIRKDAEGEKEKVKAVGAGKTGSAEKLKSEKEAANVKAETVKEAAAKKKDEKKAPEIKEAEKKVEVKSAAAAEKQEEGEKKSKAAKKKKAAGAEAAKKEENKGAETDGKKEELKKGVEKKSVDEKKKTAEKGKEGTGAAALKKGTVRTYPNGMVLEELRMGKPDGKVAKAGKMVAMRYVGKLKNGKVFDSNISGNPFKFRLGVGEVIKGWDVGVEGMRVGDKRLLKIPPAMGYGPKGAPPTIPGNSWLHFEVELVDVK